MSLEIRSPSPPSGQRQHSLSKLRRKLLKNRHPNNNNNNDIYSLNTSTTNSTSSNSPFKNNLKSVRLLNRFTKPKSNYVSLYDELWGNNNKYANEELESDDDEDNNNNDDGFHNMNEQFSTTSSVTSTDEQNVIINRKLQKQQTRNCSLQEVLNGYVNNKSDLSALSSEVSSCCSNSSSSIHTSLSYHYNDDNNNNNNNNNENDDDCGDDSDDDSFRLPHQYHSNNKKDIKIGRQDLFRHQQQQQKQQHKQFGGGTGSEEDDTSATTTCSSSSENDDSTIDDYDRFDGAIMRTSTRSLYDNDTNNTKIVLQEEENIMHHMSNNVQLENVEDNNDIRFQLCNQDQHTDFVVDDSNHKTKNILHVKKLRPPRTSPLVLSRRRRRLSDSFGNNHNNNTKFNTNLDMIRNHNNNESKSFDTIDMNDDDDSFDSFFSLSSTTLTLDDINESFLIRDNNYIHKNDNNNNNNDINESIKLFSPSSSEPIVISTPTITTNSNSFSPTSSSEITTITTICSSNKSNISNNNVVKWSDECNQPLETIHILNTIQDETCRIIIVLMNAPMAPYEFLHCEFNTQKRLKINDILKQLPNLRKLQQLNEDQYDNNQYNIINSINNIKYTSLCLLGKELINMLAIQDYFFPKTTNNDNPNTITTNRTNILRDGTIFIAVREGCNVKNTIIESDILLSNKLLRREIRKARIAGRALRTLLCTEEFIIKEEQLKIQYKQQQKIEKRKQAKKKQKQKICKLKEENESNNNDDSSCNTSNNDCPKAIGSLITKDSKENNDMKEDLEEHAEQVSQTSLLSMNKEESKHDEVVSLCSSIDDNDFKLCYNNFVDSNFDKFNNVCPKVFMDENIYFDNKNCSNIENTKLLLFLEDYNIQIHNNNNTIIQKNINDNEKDYTAVATAHKKEERFRTLSLSDSTDMMDSLLETLQEPELVDQNNYEIQGSKITSLLNINLHQNNDSSLLEGEQSKSSLILPTMNNNYSSSLQSYQSNLFLHHNNDVEEDDDDEDDLLSNPIISCIIDDSYDKNNSKIHHNASKNNIFR